MKTIRFSGRMPTPLTMSIGVETDQNAERLRFILPQIADGQTATLQMLLPDGTPEVLNIVDGIALVPATVCSQPGRSRAWVEILGGDSVAWNSELFYLDVGDLPPIGERVEGRYPTAFQDALDAVGQTLLYKNGAEAARDRAESAAAAAISQSGILRFEIGPDGGLYIYRTPNLPYRFALEEDGGLYYYVRT